MTEQPEPKIHDIVHYGHDRTSIIAFSDDDGTRLSNGRWICASHLISTGDNEWLYTPKNVEDMTTAELRHEHRQSTRALLTNHISATLRATLLPEVERLIEEAARGAVEYVMDNHYCTPPRLMDKDTTKET